MSIKRLMTIVLTMVLALTLLTACPFGSDTPDGGTSGGGDVAAPPEATPTPTETPVPTPEPKDPCPCCPDCIQEECECVECGDSDDCKCKLPGSVGSFTFLVEIDINQIDSGGKSIISFVEATVLLDDFNSTGWFGGTEVSGEHTYLGWEYEEVILCWDYVFSVKLSDFDPQKSDCITIDIDNYCDIEECFIKMNLLYYGIHYDFIDEETGGYTFELPMEGGVAKLENHWNDGVTVDMTITVTLVDQSTRCH